MSQNSFVRVPPDSVGKRVRNRVDIVVDYNSGTRLFNKGEVVLATSSSAIGVVHDIEGSATAGDVTIFLTNNVEAFTAGEDLTVEGSTIATASSIGVPRYTQTTQIAGGNRIGNLVQVGAQGGAFVRTEDGPMESDAFGKLRTSSEVISREYILKYDDLPGEFTTTLTGSATSAHNQDEAAVTLQVGTSSGAKAERRSNLYHKYQAGISQLIEMTLHIGDTGKADVRRRWGYYDDNDGVLFQLDGTTLSVIQRSSTSGSPVDTVVNQPNFNRDVGDGTGVTEVNVDVSKVNIWWIDLQWLGSGRVRMGVVLQGERLVLHEFRNANNLTDAYMKTATLPVSWEIENTGGSGSTSEMKVICSVVKTEGELSPAQNSYGFIADQLRTVNAASNIPLLSFRAAASHLGIENRAVLLPYSIEIFGTAGSAPTAIAVEVSKNPTLTSASFDAALPTDSLAEIDTSAIDASTDGIPLIAKVINPVANQGETIDLLPVFQYDGEVCIRKAFIASAADVYTVHARALVGSADLTALINWREIL